MGSFLNSSFCHGFAISALMIVSTMTSAEQTENNKRTSDNKENVSQKELGKIEKIVITAEKRASTVEDTSIAISAFTDETLEKNVIKDLEALTRFIPGTHAEGGVIRVRGVGKNFKELGGDPGIAIYQNGVYAVTAVDAGTSQTEGGLWDLERIEVLRGPQGTLFGRNAVGGAINYINKKPTFDFEGAARATIGNYNTREFFGAISGPLIEDTLAARLTGSIQKNSGLQKGIGDNPDTDNTNTRNVALYLLWDISDTMELEIRANDRKFEQLPWQAELLNHGSSTSRGQQNTHLEVNGLRQVDANTPGAMPYTNPLTGETKYAVFSRAGQDWVNWPFQPNPFYGTNPNDYQLGLNGANTRNGVKTNHDPRCNTYPYTKCDSNHEYFRHNGGHLKFTWNTSETSQLAFIAGHSDSDYTYNWDIDAQDVDFTKYRQTMQERLVSHSQELQFNWQLGDKFKAVSGLYRFKDIRSQIYSLSDTTNRFVNPVDYSGWERNGFGNVVAWMDKDGDGKIDGAPIGTAGPNTQITAGWLGDPRGDVYTGDNSIVTTATAFYTQGTYEFNDQWQLTLGIRHAKDRKEIDEKRMAYWEDPITWAGNGFAESMPELTRLGAMNVIMGNATYDPSLNNPFVPKCRIDDANCTTPLRLGGLPMQVSSWLQAGDEWQDTNYRINLDWKPTDDTLAYFAFTTGYRAGGYTLGTSGGRDVERDENGVQISAKLKPAKYGAEEVKSTELGLKSIFYDGTIQTALAVYNYDYTGYQDRVWGLDPVTNRLIDIGQNANGVINRGFEIETKWYPTPNLELGANYSFTDAKFHEDYYVADYTDPDLPFLLFPIDLKKEPDHPDNVAFKNLKGNQLKFIPKHKGAIWLDYLMGDFELIASYSITGRFFSSSFNRAIDEIPSTGRLDASLIWNSKDGNWQSMLYASNLTNERTCWAINNKGMEHNFPSNCYANAPRRFGLQVTYNFN